MPSQPKTETKQIFRAPRMDPALKRTEAPAQPRQARVQRSFGAPVGDTRTDFPQPLGTMPTGYPSTARPAKSMGQPRDPAVDPVEEFEWSNKREVKIPGR